MKSESDGQPSDTELIEFVLDSGGSVTMAQVMSYFEHADADRWLDDLEEKGLVETNVGTSGVTWTLTDDGMSFLEPDDDSGDGLDRWDVKERLDVHGPPAHAIAEAFDSLEEIGRYAYDGKDFTDLEGVGPSTGETLEERSEELIETYVKSDPLADESTNPDLSDHSETIVLVGCGDAKADESRPAKEIYTSNYFGLKRRYAEAYGDEWAILSAEHGLLDPDVEIEPYDTHISDVSVGEWSLSVVKALPDVNGSRVILLAGPDYVDAIEGDLMMFGADVEIPTAGMKIGERMSWLSDQLDDDDRDDDQDSDDADSPAPIEEPPAPDDAPKYVREGLEKQDPDTLRDLAHYARALADYKEADAERQLEEQAADVDDVPEEWDADEWNETVEKADAPKRATLTTKEIDGRSYFYYQWREDDSIKSEYLAPVTPS